MNKNEFSKKMEWVFKQAGTYADERLEIASTTLALRDRLPDKYDLDLMLLEYIISLALHSGLRGVGQLYLNHPDEVFPKIFNLISDDEGS